MLIKNLFKLIYSLKVLKISRNVDYFFYKNNYIIIFFSVFPKYISDLLLLKSEIYLIISTLYLLLYGVYKQRTVSLENLFFIIYTKTLEILVFSLRAKLSSTP